MKQIKRRRQVQIGYRQVTTAVLVYFQVRAGLRLRRYQPSDKALARLKALLVPPRWECEKEVRERIAWEVYSEIPLKVKRVWVPPKGPPQLFDE